MRSWGRALRTTALGSMRLVRVALPLLSLTFWAVGSASAPQGQIERRMAQKRRSAMCLEVGQTAPDFELPDSDGKMHRLSDYRGHKVVLYFYPRDNTPGCTKEACSFRDYHAEFEKHGIVVLGVSPDSVSSHKKFAEKYSLPFPLLADPEHKVLELYGVWQEKTVGGKKRWGVKRTTYIIDEQGKISHVFKKVNTAIHAQEVLEALGLAEGAK